MRVVLMGAVVLVAVASGCRPAAPPTTGGEPAQPRHPLDALDWRAMQGSWKVVEATRSEEGNDRELASIKFEDNTVTFFPKGGGEPKQWRYGIGPYANPKHFDIRDPNAPPLPKRIPNPKERPAPDPALMPGIYEINGGEMVLVIHWTPGSEERPTSVESKLKGKMVRYRLEHVK